MKNLLKQVFRPNWMNLIKIVSLTLGFTVSVALMCRIAWFNSFDNFWQDGENLYIVEQTNDWVASGEIDLRNRCFSGIAPFIASHISSVESATRFQYEGRSYLVNEEQFRFTNCYVDEYFFDVLKINMITGGNPKEILQQRGNVILTAAAAKVLFPDGNVLGQIIKNDAEVFTVGGVCEDIPENSFLPEIDMIVEIDIPMIFDSDDVWYTFLRTHKNTNHQELNKEINELLDPLYAVAATDFGVHISFCATHFKEFSKREHVDIKGWILVFMVLLITGLNFALLSISSLVSRAKEVGVRKASGARSSGIFLLIIWEATAYVIMAALLSWILLWGLQAQLDEMFGKYDNIFAFENLWGVGLVMILLILIAGVLPAWVFARIPVTQVFQRFTQNRLLWKRILLFFQFTASIFVISLMFVALRQLQVVIAHHYGYDSEKLVWMFIEDPVETQLQTLISEIGLDNRVEAINVSNRSIWYGFPGTTTTREPECKNLLNVRCLYTDSAFFKTYGVKILRGDSLLSGNRKIAGNVVVNQAFIYIMQIDENPIGEQFFNINSDKGAVESIPLTISGVCQDFETLREGNEPTVIMARDTHENCFVIIRVNEVTAEVVDMIGEKVRKNYPNTVYPRISICSDTIFWHFHRLRLDGNIFIFASICLLIITIVGTLGYVNIEIRRRTKEIAIRKIHGSTALSIIWKISRELIFITLLATPIAITLAYFFGVYWQQNFAIKATLSWYLFAAAALIIALTVAVCTIIQTWRTANANPARAIKSD